MVNDGEFFLNVQCTLKR